MNRHTFLRNALAAAIGAGLACAAQAQAPSPSAADVAAYPNRVIRIVVPYPPGAINDILARAVAEKLRVSMGQPVIVENRAGAGAVLGTEAVASAAPDGYTLLQAPAAHAINATLVPRLPYDTIRSFSFITLAATSPFVLISNPSFPARSVRELVSLAKAKPGAYAYASSGNGGTAHLMGEMLNDMAGIKVLHVPYKGTSPAMTDLIGGQVQYTFSSYPGAVSAIKSGRVRVLAVTGKSRWPNLPDVPTIAEAGYDYDASGWWGYLAPTGTPKAIVDKLNREINKALADPALRSNLAAEGLEIKGTTPEEFLAHTRAEIDRWGKIIRQADIKTN